MNCALPEVGCDPDMSSMGLKCQGKSIISNIFSLERMWDDLSLLIRFPDQFLKLCLKQDSYILGHISAFDFPGHSPSCPEAWGRLQGPSDAASELAFHSSSLICESTLAVTWVILSWVIGGQMWCLSCQRASESPPPPAALQPVMLHLI